MIYVNSESILNNDRFFSLYRGMVIHIIGENHFSITYYLEEEKRWILSPAYDLTYSNSLGGEHATTVHGNGANPGIPDILAVAKEIGINQKKAKQIAKQIQECVL